MKRDPAGTEFIFSKAEMGGPVVRKLRKAKGIGVGSRNGQGHCFLGDVECCGNILSKEGKVEPLKHRFVNPPLSGFKRKKLGLVAVEVDR